MSKLVLKFGGNQLKDADSIKKACEIVASTYKKERPELLITVVSATGKVGEKRLEDKITNLLEQIYEKKDIKENLGEVKSRVERISTGLGLEKDYLGFYIKELEKAIDNNKGKDKGYSAIVSFGEKVSAEIFSRYLSKFIPCKQLNFDEFGMLTDEYKDAEALPEALVEIEKSFSDKKGIIVVPGFLGYNSKGEITTLGRDGSNYTATKIAEAILADEVRIYSDMTGVKRASPLFVPDTEIIPELTYNEAIEFAELGAKIINAKAIGPASRENIPIYIIDEKRKGTKISSHISLEHMGAKIIASVPNHYVLTVHYEKDKPGVLADVAKCFAKEGINIEAIADERHAISFAFLPNEKIGDVMKKLGKYKLDLENKVARISLIGERMKEQVGVIEKIAKVYRKKGISFEMISQAMSQLNVTNFIKEEHERIAVRGLYNEFFRNSKK